MFLFTKIFNIYKRLIFFSTIFNEVKKGFLSLINADTKLTAQVKVLRKVDQNFLEAEKQEWIRMRKHINARANRLLYICQLQV